MTYTDIHKLVEAKKLILEVYENNYGIANSQLLQIASNLGKLISILRLHHDD